MDEQDAQLLAAAKAGDYDAFEALHQRLEPVVARFVRRLIGVGQEAEDIVQDTLLALYLNLPKLDPPEKLRPFLFRVARNRCTDLLRHQGRWEHLALEDDESPLHLHIAYDMASDTVQPEDTAGWLMLYMEVKEAMDRLPEMQRQTLICYCEESLSYAEIAEVTDVSIGTVKSRLFHAKKNLRGLLSSRTLSAIEDALGLWDEPTAVPKKRVVTREKGNQDGHGSKHYQQTARLHKSAAGASAVGGTGDQH